MLRNINIISKITLYPIYYVLMNTPGPRIYLVLQIYFSPVKYQTFMWLCNSDLLFKCNWNRRKMFDNSYQIFIPKQFVNNLYCCAENLSIYLSHKVGNASFESNFTIKDKTWFRIHLVKHSKACLFTSLSSANRSTVTFRLTISSF